MMITLLFTLLSPIILEIDCFVLNFSCPLLYTNTSHINHFNDYIYAYIQKRPYFVKYNPINDTRITYV